MNLGGLELTGYFGVGLELAEFFVAGLPPAPGVLPAPLPLASALTAAVLPSSEVLLSMSS